MQPSHTFDYPAATLNAFVALWQHASTGLVVHLFDQSLVKQVNNNLLSLQQFSTSAWFELYDSHQYDLYEYGVTNRDVR